MVDTLHIAFNLYGELVPKVFIISFEGSLKKLHNCPPFNNKRYAGDPLMRDLNQYIVGVFEMRSINLCCILVTAMLTISYIPVGITYFFGPRNNFKNWHFRAASNGSKHATPCHINVFGKINTGDFIGFNS